MWVDQALTPNAPLPPKAGIRWAGRGVHLEPLPMAPLGCGAGIGIPRDPQRSPESPCGSPEIHRDPQKSTGIPRDPQRFPEIPRDPRPLCARALLTPSTAFPNPGDTEPAGGSPQQPGETALIYSKGLNSLVSLFFVFLIIGDDTLQQENKQTNK